MTRPSTRPKPNSLIIDRQARPTNLRPIGELQWQARIDRAVEKARRMPQRSWRLDVTSERHDERVPVYTVRSATQRAVWYVQYVFALGISCTCEAGKRWCPCWHAAKVALRLCREYRPLQLTDLPSSPYELFDGDEWEPGDNVTREPDVAAFVEWEVVPAICTACGCENEPGATVCQVCGVIAGEPYSDAPRNHRRQPARIEDYIA